MGKIFYPTDNEEPTEFCSGLAIGDSWFWYPNQNMLETLVRDPLLNDDHGNVRLLGYNGAELRDYVGTGKYAKEVAKWLSPKFNDGFTEFYISGAGNDAVAYNLALKPDCTEFTTATACISSKGMDEMLRRISEALAALIHNIRWAYKNDSRIRPIFIHGYDFPTPDNRGFTVGPLTAGPWLAPAMDTAKVPVDRALRFEITKILIERLRDDVFAPLDSASNDIVFINSAGTLTHFPDPGYKDDWTNELHPTTSGFGKIFNAHWRKPLSDVGILKRN